MKGSTVLLLMTIISPVCLTMPASDSKHSIKDAIKDTLVTAAEPGQEFVFVQSSGAGARPVARKDKTETSERGSGPFETAHKVPSKLTFERSEDNEEQKGKGKKVHKRQAPAPAGAIKLDVKKLLAKIKNKFHYNR
ncbi:unnamed protein product [Callosobruchus maculatus]|uniref:Uncharacterized protein n=1 Tax=Callosobruchus maculatus TaxID=64391 RepID=A0A653CAX3_CALMS|nr:unnamed protein product [Callosobruchus maculatus]